MKQGYEQYKRINTMFNKYGSITEMINLQKQAIKTLIYVQKG